MCDLGNWGWIVRLVLLFYNVVMFSCIMGFRC